MILILFFCRGYFFIQDPLYIKDRDIVAVWFHNYEIGNIVLGFKGVE